MYTNDSSILDTKVDYNTKINEIENKTNDHDHAKYMTTQEFDNLTSEHSTAKLAQIDIANFVTTQILMITKKFK